MSEMRAMQKKLLGHDKEEYCYQFACNIAAKINIPPSICNYRFTTIYYLYCQKAARYADRDVREVLPASLDVLDNALVQEHTRDVLNVQEKTVQQFCSRCQRKNPHRIKSAQTRSSDEGATIIYTCTVCQKVSAFS